MINWGKTEPTIDVVKRLEAEIDASEFIIACTEPVSKTAIAEAWARANGVPVLHIKPVLDFNTLHNTLHQMLVDHISDRDEEEIMAYEDISFTDWMKKFDV